jgi:transketolase
MIAQSRQATQLDQLRVNALHMLSMHAVKQASSGHGGTPMAMAQPVS